MNYIFLLDFEINAVAFSCYCKHCPVENMGQIVEGKKATVITESELTSTDESTLRNYVNDFENYTQEILDMSTLEKTKVWGRLMINEFEVKNMNRKRMGLMGRAELLDVLSEAHDSYLFITMLEGSLDTMHGVLYGFPEEIINDVTIPARVPFSFVSVWSEDIDWLKSELNTFLSEL